MNKNTLRDICYIVHLLTPNTRFSKEQLQELYSQTIKTHDYSASVFNDNGTAEFRIADTRTPEITKYIFSNNSILLMHDNVGRIGIDNFLEKVEDIIINSFRHLSIPLFVEQRYVIRCLANLHKLTDSRLFIAENVCSLKENNLKVYGRPIHGVGLRFFFPPTNDKLYEFDIKLESLLKDPRNLFLECQGRFFQPIQQNSMDSVKMNMTLTKEFVYSNMSDFLCQFNIKGER